MSAIILFLMIVLGIIISALIYLYMNTIDQSNDKSKFFRLSEYGSIHNLAFTSQETLGDKIIGLDGISKKLLVCEEKNGKSHVYIIDLDKVKSLSVKKVYNSIHAGELKRRKMDEFIRLILLQFDFMNSDPPVVFTIYETGRNSVSDLPKLEKRAMNWQVLLSKMLGKRKLPDKRAAMLSVSG